MKIGSKIIVTDTPYPYDVANGTIMTVMYFYSTGTVVAKIDGGDGTKFRMVTGTFKEQLPYGHVTLPDGRTVDLTANRIGCDLMDPNELQEMKDHDGPWEFWGGDEWRDVKPLWVSSVVYRVTPKPETQVYTRYTSEKYSWIVTAERRPSDTHEIELTIQDGRIIDLRAEEMQ